MIRALKDNWALFAGMLMLMMANGMLVTFLSIRGAAIGFSETTIGLVQAGYPLGALVGSIYAPRLVERVGHVRAFASLASLCSVCAIVHLLTTDAWSWGAMRFLAGVCFPGLYVISESWLNAKAENRTRAIVLSIYFVIQTVGAAAGQGLAGLDKTSGAMTFGLSSILVSLSLLPLMISRNRAPDYSAPDRFSMIQLARISPMAVSGAMLNGVAQAAFYVGMPLYGLARGMGAADSALLLVIGTLSGQRCSSLLDGSQIASIADSGRWTFHSVYGHRPGFGERFFRRSRLCVGGFDRCADTARLFDLRCPCQ